MVPTIHNCFKQKSVHLSLDKRFLLLIQLLLGQDEPVKTSSVSKFDYSRQLQSHTFKGLGNPDHTECSPYEYVQNILTYG